MDITLFGTITPARGPWLDRGIWTLVLGDNSLLELLDKKEVQFDTLEGAINLVHDAGKDAFVPFNGKQVRVKGTLHLQGMPDDSKAFVHVTAVEIAGISGVELVGVLDADGHWFTIQRASENARHFVGEKVFVWAGDLGVIMNKTLEPFHGKACVITGDLNRQFGRSSQETWSVSAKEAREPQ